MTVKAADDHGLRRAALVTVALGVTFAFIWSSAFTAGKVALEWAPPVLLLTARFFVSGVLAIALAVALGQRLPRQPAQWVRIGVLGVCQNTIYLGMMFVAMTRIEAGLAAIIGSMLPLVVAALAPLVLRERVGPLKVAGLVLGFAGVVYIMHDRATGAGTADFAGMAVAFLGVVGLATGTALVRRGDFGTGLMMVVGLQMMVGSLTLLPFAIWLEDPAQVVPSPALLLSFAYIVLLPGIGATFLWFTLVARSSATDAAAYHFLNPAFGVAVAWAVLGEAVGWADAVGAALVAAGILMVNRADRAAAGARRPADI